MALNKLELSDLLAVYGNMLTDKQREALAMYCDCDCSLAEISEEVGISRQGVRDAIMNGERMLVKLDEALHFVDFYHQVLSGLQQDDMSIISAAVAGFVSKE